MGCGCGKKQIPGKNSSNQDSQQQKQASSGDTKTPKQVRQERVNKLVSIPGTKQR